MHKLLIATGNRPKNGVVKNCDTCDSEFYVSMAFISKKFCSYRCAYISQGLSDYKPQDGEVMIETIYKNHYITNMGKALTKCKTNDFMVRKPYYNKQKNRVYVWMNGKTRNLARLVATAFIPNPVGKPEVNHIDGNTKNNHVSNLEWVTKSENAKHSYDILGQKKMRGSLSGQSILTEDDVINIRLLKGKMTYNDIANKYNVKYSTIASILSGRNWSWLK